MIRAPPHPPHCDRHLPLKGKAFAAKVPCRFRRGRKLLYWNQMPHGGFLNKKIFGKFKRTRFCGMIIAIRQFRRARRPCRTGKARRPAPWNKTQGHRVKNARPRVQKCLGTGKKTPGHVCRPASPNAAARPSGGTPKRNLAACVLPAPGHAKRPVAPFTALRPSPKTAPRNCTKKGGIHP